MRKLIVVVLLGLGGVIAGYFLNDYLSRPSNVNEVETSDVLLQQIRKVLKVVTVEGEFSEIYTYDNIWHLLSIYPAQKKAIVRVNATVMVGYDLEGVDIDILEREKVVYIRNIPAPKILSLQKSLDYYDITESTFNQFKEQDFNRIERRTEGQIKEKVSQSDLYVKAEEQLNSYLETLRVLLKESGWELKRSEDLPREFQENALKDDGYGMG